MIIDAGELLFILNIIAYAIYAPYTKVEESFNIQACHDILTYGLDFKALSRWDHQEFPGAVPRTFIGALILSGLTYIPLRLAEALLNVPLTGLQQQIVLRVILGLVNAACMIYLKRVLARVHGQATALFYLALQGTQFHVMYYASRTLPNFFAFPLTTLATAALVRNDPYTAIILLTVATVIFRSEIVIFLGTIVLHQLYQQRISFVKTINYGFISGLLSLTFSGVVDSFVWGYHVVPEVAGILFNVLHGKSSEWGTSPWYTYALDVLKLLLNPLSLPLIAYATYVHKRQVLPLLIPIVAFCTIYSIQPHKEWRFIVYIVPGLTTIAALGAAHIYKRRSKTMLYRLMTIAILASIPCTGMLSHTMGLISAMSYPGGQIMSRIPDTTQPVYLDVLTCMTGSTKFLQQQKSYERSEDKDSLTSQEFWDNLKYAAVSDPSVVMNSTVSWVIRDRVYGYSGIDVRGLKIKKEIKLYLMERLDY